MDMKITVRGNQQQQIIDGVEPFETAEVDVALDALTPEQRVILAGNPTLTVVRANAESVVAELQRRVDEAAAQQAREVERAQKHNEDARQRCADATLTETAVSSAGVSYIRYGCPSISDYFVADRAVRELVRTTVERLTAEAAAKSAAAKAAVQDQIDEALAQRRIEEEAEAAAEAEAKRLRKAERLSSGIVTIPWSRDDRREWGDPWIAKVEAGNGKNNYDFSEGTYDLSTETLRIPCVPGEVIAYGQKNHRKPRRTCHEIKKMNADGGLVAV